MGRKPITELSMNGYIREMYRLGIPNLVDKVNSSEPRKREDLILLKSKYVLLEARMYKVYKEGRRRDESIRLARRGLSEVQACIEELEEM